MADNVLALLGIGVLFIVIGLAAFIWDRKESKSYYNSIAGRQDMREFFNHWPPRAEFGALKIGGWISVVIGIIMLITGGVFWLIG